jgi:ribosomal protein S18 acetylase RimI-like enzyme
VTDVGHTGAVISELDLTDDVVAANVHKLGRRAYAVEAELIGSTAIPALHETMDEMRAESLRWFGAWTDECLAGFAAWNRGPHGLLDIERLCVDPDFFRRGIASRLLRRVLAEGGNATVSTGAANIPAIGLYERFGFTRTATHSPEPGVTLAVFTLIRNSGRVDSL